MKAGDLVLVRFPQSDLQEGKLRPALVVALAPGRHQDVLLAMISSRSYQVIPDFDETIEPSDKDYGSSGLKARSVVRLSRLATVDSAVIHANLGEISSDRLREVKKRLVSWLQK